MTWLCWINKQLPSAGGPALPAEVPRRHRRRERAAALQGPVRGQQGGAGVLHAGGRGPAVRHLREDIQEHGEGTLSTLQDGPEKGKLTYMYDLYSICLKKLREAFR